MFRELKRILLESPLNEETQLAVEMFLRHQASLLFNEKINLNKNLDLKIKKSPF